MLYDSGTIFLCWVSPIRFLSVVSCRFLAALTARRDSLHRRPITLSAGWRIAAKSRGDWSFSEPRQHRGTKNPRQPTIKFVFVVGERESTERRGERDYSEECDPVPRWPWPRWLKTGWNSFVTGASGGDSTPLNPTLPRALRARVYMPVYTGITKKKHLRAAARYGRGEPNTFHIIIISDYSFGYAVSFRPAM